jgi:hypothetical protein
MNRDTFIRMSLAIILVVSAGILSFMFASDVDSLISGKATSMVYIYESPPDNCTIVLKEGINMVSFFCDGGNLPVNESLVNSNGDVLNYYAVFEYVPNNLNDSWNSYNPELPSWAIQSVNGFNRRAGYAIVMNSSGEYYHEGYKFSNNVILLKTGWNFIGYPSDLSRNITSVLAQIHGKYVRVEAYQNYVGDNYWRSYPNVSGNTIENFEPMIGYWILMNQSGQLVVNW